MPPSLPSPMPPPPDYRIVRAWPADDVVALYESAGWWREGSAGRAAIPAMIAGSFCFAVAVVGERAVAMGRAISDGVSDGYIQDVVVLPAWRGRGVGPGRRLYAVSGSDGSRLPSCEACSPRPRSER